MFLGVWWEEMSLESSREAACTGGLILYLKDSGAEGQREQIHEHGRQVGLLSPSGTLVDG